MTSPSIDRLLVRLPDGTVKQRNPFTDTQVWTVPGRGNRPLTAPPADDRPLQPGDAGRLCAFCVDRQDETPPELSRLVLGSPDDEVAATVGTPWPVSFVERPRLPQRDLGSEVPQFRRIPNLFEILSLDYWQQNHGFVPNAHARERCRAWLDDPAGRAHLVGVATTRRRAAGVTPPEPDDEALAHLALGWFATAHEVVVPRRHVVDDAAGTGQLASSGTLGVDEHRAYIGFTVAAMADQYRWNPAVRYVSVFQNWLKPAGASFDHLHKQVVAIDEYGSHIERIAARLDEDPRACTDLVVRPAAREGLLLAANDHAVAHVGFGHRYPSVEVWSKSPLQPWLQAPAEVAAMSDLLHAVHAAVGAGVPANEEWHHRPPGLDQRIPWRVLMKLRSSTLAGFEGATRIYLTTISPWDLRDRLLPRLHELRDAGGIGPMRLGDECTPADAQLADAASA